MKGLIREHLKKLVSENKAFTEYNKLESWYNGIKQELEKIKDYKTWKYKSKAYSREYIRLKGELDKKYGDELYGLGGDVSVKYIYHYTTGNNLPSIINSDELLGGGNEYGGISFSSDGNLWRNKFIFYHSSEYYEGVNYRNVGVRFKFDFNKMIADGYKFKRGSENIDTSYGEFELRLRKNELPNMSKYLVNITIIKDKEKDYIKLIEFLSSKNIKYTLV